jgi:hypothetical protein
MRLRNAKGQFFSKEQLMICPKAQACKRCAAIHRDYPRHDQPHVWRKHSCSEECTEYPNTICIPYVEPVIEGTQSLNGADVFGVRPEPDQEANQILQQKQEVREKIAFFLRAYANEINGDVTLFDWKDLIQADKDIWLMCADKFRETFPELAIVAEDQRRPENPHRKLNKPTDNWYAYNQGYHQAQEDMKEFKKVLK